MEQIAEKSNSNIKDLLRGIFIGTGITCLVVASNMDDYKRMTREVMTTPTKNQ